MECSEILRGAQVGGKKIWETRGARKRKEGLKKVDQVIGLETADGGLLEGYKEREIDSGVVLFRTCLTPWVLYHRLFASCADYRLT